MVLARRGMKYEDVTIENIMAPPALVPALKDGKVDAIVSWEPFNTLVLENVPESYAVIRGGGHLSYIMVITAHEPTLQASPQVIRGLVAGLAAASQYTRRNRDEAVEIFSRWVPGINLGVGKKAAERLAILKALPIFIQVTDTAEQGCLPLKSIDIFFATGFLF